MSFRENHRPRPSECAGVISTNDFCFLKSPGADERLRISGQRREYGEDDGNDESLTHCDLLDFGWNGQCSRTVGRHKS